MRDKRAFLFLITACFVASGLALYCAGPTCAQAKSTDYTFLMASGFLCDAGDPDNCPAIAKSASGDSYEMSGAGMFDAEKKSLQAAGTFAHKSASGVVLQTGVWTASELLSFASYGVASTALLHERAELGPQVMGPKRSQILSGVMPTGGLAILRILLMPVSGNARTGELQINCTLGNVPSERSVEGIRLVFDGGGNVFSEVTVGRVMFLLVRGTALPKANVVKPETTQLVSF
jgi:hypothetical protein